ncbi:unnamed protein product, partial [Effrenium voratum]
VLGPGRITTLATTCKEAQGNACARLGEFENVLSSVFVSYCRGPADGARCFEVQADKCGLSSPIDLAQAGQYQEMTNTSVAIPCWYNRLQEQTQETTEEEATQSSCDASGCSFYKTSKARYTVRLNEEPCATPRAKGSVGVTVVLGMLVCGACLCSVGCAFRSRRELLTDYEDEFTET